MHWSEQTPCSNNTQEDPIHGHHQMINTKIFDYILCSQRWRCSIQPAKTRPGAECGSDHELVIAKFRLKLKKVGKTTRPFRYEPNHVPCDYTVEMTNRFKRLDLIDRAPENYGQRFVTLYRRWWSKASPIKRNARRKNSFLKRPYEQMRKEEMLKAKEKRKDIHKWI